MAHDLRDWLVPLRDRTRRPAAAADEAVVTYSSPPRRARLPSLAEVAETARETGQRVEVTDGSRTYAAEPPLASQGVEIETPEQLRRLI